MDYGWAGKILFINLTKKTTCLEKTNQYLSFIGGRGINQWLLFDHLEKDSDPLGPSNIVILGAGPLVGTLVPGAGRLAVDFKNVITEGVGSGNSGGHFAAEMKFAGYDHIVIMGKAKKPIYLYIHNDKVYFRDAENLWGKNTWQTENVIKCQEKEKGLKTLTIGPGGENLVKFACIIGDRGRAVGYGGSGAIFGSKKLKAVAIRGTLPLNIACPDQLMEKVRVFNKRNIEKSYTVKMYRKGGTLLPYLAPGENRPHGVKNMSEEFWSNDAICCVTREKFDQYLKKRRSCFNCPSYCSSIYEINGLRCEGIQANTLRALGSNLDLRSPEDILYANALVNMYGIDTDQTSAVIAWAIECFENGLINENDTDGIELRWGKGDSILKMIENITYRKGFGNILAEGVYEACKTIGRGTEKYTVMVKKNSLMEAGMRSHKGWALGIVTSTKGGGHLRGAPGQEMQKISPELSMKLFGIGDISNPTSYQNKPELVVWQEKYKGIIDMMGLCVSNSMWMDINLFTPDDIAEFYNYTTGENVFGEYLMHVGEKIQNLERIFNYLYAGFDRKDDYPPEKLMTIPVHAGNYKGEKLELDKWDQMLNEYYTFHQWDKETGIPTKETLIKLGLTDVIEKLKVNGIKLK